MFKSEASLFLSASTNVNSAKSLINKCKQIIVNFELSGNENAQSLKENINGCDIDSLVTKIENTKQSLMQLGSDFTAEYMTALTTALTTTSLDTSDMTEEQQMQYQMQMSSYEREYNEALLHMLEQHEESGQLTEEMQQQLEYQRQLVAQYDIQDQMSVLDPTSEEYIELFKTKSENDMALINSNPNLTDEQKQNYLSEYVSQYTYNIGKLSEARDTKLKNEALEQELMDLYAAKEENSGFWHPFVETEIDEAILDTKIELGIATEDEIAYKNMDGWDRFLADTETFSTSTFAGLFNIVEGVGDAFVMAGSAVNVCDKEWASEYIARDISGEMYQGLVLSNDMNSYSAYGTWHDAGLIFGESVGKIGITFAAPWASGTLYGLNAMGQSAETAFNNGDDYWTALAKSTVAGVGGFAEGYGMSKLNLEMRKFASSGALKQAGRQIINNASSNIKSATFKTVLKNGFVSTINEADAWIETGCTFASNILEGVSSGDIDWKKTIKETGMVFATNLVMNSVTDLAFHVDASKPKVDASISADIDTPSTTVVEDLYINKAQDILDPNTATNLSSEIGKLNNDELQKVLTVMNGTEIASQLKYLESSEVDRVLHSLSGTQTTELVGEIAERFSKDGIDADLFRKIDPSLQLEILERTDITQTLVHARTNPDGAILILDEISKGNYGYDFGYEEVKKMLEDTTRGMAYSSDDAATAIINMEKYFENNYNDILDDKLWDAAKDSLPPGASSTQIKAQMEVIKSDPKLFQQVVDTTNNAATSNLLVVQKNMISALSDETINGVPKAYNNATDFFADMAEKKSGNLSSRVTSEYKDYVTKQFDPTGSGVSRVGAFYSNDNLKFVCNIPGEQTSTLLMKEMLNGSEIINVEVGSFGRIGDRQFVSAALEQENLIDSINRFGGEARTTVAAATGLPSTGTDRLVRITGDTPTSMLELHSGIEGGSNYQAVSGGLPDYEFNGTRNMMVESTIPAVQTGSRNFTNVKFDVYNPDTAQLINSYELVKEGNKWFLKLI